MKGLLFSSDFQETEMEIPKSLDQLHGGMLD